MWTKLHKPAQHCQFQPDQPKLRRENSKLFNFTLIESHITVAPLWAETAKNSPILQNLVFGNIRTQGSRQISKSGILCKNPDFIRVFPDNYPKSGFSDFFRIFFQKSNLWVYLYSLEKFGQIWTFGCPNIAKFWLKFTESDPHAKAEFILENISSGHSLTSHSLRYIRSFVLHKVSECYLSECDMSECPGQMFSR